MIKFFRKLRYNLMETGKTGKPVLPAGRYFKYAIGEIILVVIGILIALQINNWNQQKLERKQELTMLSEVQTALKSDIEYLEGLITRMERTRSAAKVFTQVINQENTKANDSLISTLDELMLGYAYTYNSGPYEAIKSAGINLISNKELRNQLINIYDFQLTRNKIFLSDLILDQLTEAYNLRDEFLNVKPYLDEEGEIHYNYSFKTENALQQPEFIFIFKTFENASRQLIYRLSILNPRLKNLAALIEEELHSE